MLQQEGKRVVLIVQLLQLFGFLGGARPGPSRP
jgi:hypothetical protein